VRKIKTKYNSIFYVVMLLLDHWTQKVEAQHSFKTSVTVNYLTWGCIPEDLFLHINTIVRTSNILLFCN